MPETTQTQDTGVTSMSLLDFLTDSQQNALRGKILPNDREEYLKDVPQTQDVLVAYIVSKARKEANDRIYSQSKPGYLNTLLNWFRSTQSEAEAVAAQAFNRIGEIREAITPAQRVNLCEALKASLLKGRTSMESDTENAYLTTCITLRVDPKDVR